MRTISNTLDEAARAGQTLNIRGVLILADGTTITLPKTAFHTVSFEGGTSSSGQFDIGAAIIGSFSFVLNNYDGDYTDITYQGARIIPFIGLENDDIQVGEYWIVRHRFAGCLIQIDAYDGLKLCDKEYIPLSSFPMTAQDLVDYIADNHGWTRVTSFANNNTVLPIPENRLTERQALSYMAAVTGNFVRMDYTGKLIVDWYKSTSDITVEATLSSPIVDISDTIVSGVEYGDATYGTTDYLLQLDDNPFITDTNQSTILTNVYNQVHGLTFRAGAADVLLHPAIEAGDRVEIPDGNEGTCSLLVTTWRHKLGLSESILCDAQTEEEMDLRPHAADTEGAVLYTWIVYADDDQGTNISISSLNKDYMGVAPNRASFTPDLSDPTVYSWSKITGEDGASLYTWVAYADDDEGTGISLSSEGKDYIGLAYNQQSAVVDITVPSIFDWAKIVGETGATGPQGDTGPEAVVTVYASEIDWEAGTATLNALLRVNGLVVTPTSYSWIKTANGTHTSVGTDSATLSVTTQMGLNAVYSCIVEW